MFQKIARFLSLFWLRPFETATEGGSKERLRRAALTGSAMQASSGSTASSANLRNSGSATSSTAPASSFFHAGMDLLRNENPVANPSNGRG